MGPTAQDFRAAFGLGDFPLRINTIDADGVALAGVQALDTRTSALRATVDDLRRENDELRARLARLEAGTGREVRPVMRTLISVSFVLAILAASAGTSAGQTLGTFRWQLQPYCNVITVTVVQDGGQYHVEGTDDQCGTPRRASVVGLAFPNADGTIGMGLTIVTTPGGAPAHIDARVSLATIGGPWTRQRRPQRLVRAHSGRRDRRRAPALAVVGPSGHPAAERRRHRRRGRHLRSRALPASGAGFRCCGTRQRGVSGRPRPRQPLGRRQHRGLQRRVRFETTARQRAL